MSLIVYAGNKENSLFVTNERAASRRTEENEKEGRKSTIYAGDLGVRQDSITIKKKQAQKQAMKVLGDVFESEKEMDQSMDDMETKIQELRDENLGYYKEMSQIDSVREQRMEACGVTADSMEQQDLELLRKERDMEKPGADITLTEDEWQRLSEIHETGISEYQREMLELDEREEIDREKISKNEKNMKEIRSALIDTQIERLKTHPMVDASKEAEEILQAANKEIYGELINEGRKHIEEKIEEEKKKAEERAEKKEEEEKKEAKREERKELQEEMIEKASYNSSKSKMDKEMEEILDDLKLIKEDLKGAAVDENI